MSDSSKDILEGYNRHPEACWAEHCYNRGDKKCGQCKTAMYCTSACQKKHWPIHKQTCKKPESSKKSDKPKIYFSTDQDLAAKIDTILNILRENPNSPMTLNALNGLNEIAKEDVNHLLLINTDVVNVTTSILKNHSVSLDERNVALYALIYLSAVSEKYNKVFCKAMAEPATGLLPCIIKLIQLGDSHLSRLNAVGLLMNISSKSNTLRMSVLASVDPESTEQVNVMEILMIVITEDSNDQVKANILGLFRILQDFSECTAIMKEKTDNSILPFLLDIIEDSQNRNVQQESLQAATQFVSGDIPISLVERVTLLCKKLLLEGTYENKVTALGALANITDTVEKQIAVGNPNLGSVFVDSKGLTHVCDYGMWPILIQIARYCGGPATQLRMGALGVLIHMIGPESNRELAKEPVFGFENDLRNIIKENAQEQCVELARILLKAVFED